MVHLPRENKGKDAQGRMTTTCVIKCNDSKEEEPEGLEERTAFQRRHSWSNDEERPELFCLGVFYELHKPSRISFFLACAHVWRGLRVLYVINCLETIQSIVFSSSLDYDSLQKPMNSLGYIMSELKCLINQLIQSFNSLPPLYDARLDVTCIKWQSHYLRCLQAT